HLRPSDLTAELTAMRAAGDTHKCTPRGGECTMLRLTALGALLLVGFMGVAAAAPGADVGQPVPAISTMSHADAAIGRGGGASEAGQGQVGSKTATFLRNELAPLFFIVVA